MVHFAAHLSAYGPFLYGFDVAGVEFRGKMQLLCSSLRRSPKFHGNAAPTDAAPLHTNAAHLQLIAAPMHFRNIRVDGDVGGEDTTRRSS